MTEAQSLIEDSVEHQFAREVHNPIPHSLTGGAGKPYGDRSFAYRLWVGLRIFRRDDVKYAAKVGAGAVLYAMWSFFPSTRGFYSHWRGEWGLLSYMLVCSMVSV